MNGNKILNISVDECIDKAKSHKISSENATQLYNGINSYFSGAKDKPLKKADKIIWITDYKNGCEMTEYKDNRDRNMTKIRKCNHKQMKDILESIFSEPYDNKYKLMIDNKQLFLFYFKETKMDGNII